MGGGLCAAAVFGAQAVISVTPFAKKGLAWVEYPFFPPKLVRSFA